MTLKVVAVHPDRRQVQLDVTLPMGVINHATISATAIDAASCRVQYG